MENVSSLRMAERDSADKPREKALKYGVDHLTNSELIAIILGSGLPGTSVLDLATDILKTNDNRLSNVARMSILELCTRYKGVGNAKAISLLAAIELGSRCVNAFSMEMENPQIRSSSDVYNLMTHNLQRIEHEEFWVLFLNQANRVQSRERISIGGVAGTIADIKIIMKMAINRLAAGIIAVHNHPSGTLKPSIQDDNLTRKIKESCNFFDIKLLDHVIITPKAFYSYNDEGRL